MLTSLVHTLCSHRLFKPSALTICSHPLFALSLSSHLCSQVLLEPRVPATLQRKAVLLMLALTAQPIAPAAFRPYERRLAMLAMQTPSEGGSHAAQHLSELLAKLAAATT